MIGYGFYALFLARILIYAYDLVAFESVGVVVGGRQ